MQKAQRLGLMLALLMSLMMVASTAMAQQRANVGQLVSGLLNVNIGAVQADVDLSDFTLVDIDSINISDNEVRILNNVLNNNRILNDIQIELTDVLQNFLNDNQVVVGVLSGGIIVFQ